MPPGPILVTSPTTRSGTTLLQRLITSSDNGICYGENTGRRLVELCEFAHRELLDLQANEERHKYEWENVLGGNVDYWMVGLELPGEFSKHALAGAVQFFRQHYDEATKTIGKEIWGAKVPKLEFTQVVKMADLLSDLKCIYIYRNVFDVIKSQKSKNWITDKQTLIDVCREWVANTQVISVLKKNEFQNQPAMLHIVQYEELIQNLDEHIGKIEAFSGLRGIRSEVADKKVNTWLPTSSENFEPAVSYEEPGELTDGEVGIINEICATRMQELYPGL